MPISESNNSSPASSEWIPEPLLSSVEITDTPHAWKDLCWEILLQLLSLKKRIGKQILSHLTISILIGDILVQLKTSRF